MAEAPLMKVVDHCRVSPKSPQPSSSPRSITLSPFDIPWCFIFSDARYQPQKILLYQFPNSGNYTTYNDFIHHQVIPSLKTSLSLALENFYPYASKLVFPPLPETPQILYTHGDSVPFTVAESTMDFSDLVGDQIKDAKLFHALIPNLSPQIQSSEAHDWTWIIPDLLAIQVTLFPESGGLCIGIHFNHTMSDATGFMYFLKLWASICGSLQEVETTSSVVVPFLNRDVIEDTTGLQTIQLWKEWSQTFPIGPPNNNSKSSSSSSHDEVVRATFILSKTNINRLKHWIILKQQSTLSNYNISSFAVICAFAWVCIEKSKEELDDGVVVDDNEENQEECVFIFSADARNRLKPQTPGMFFGNCVVPCFVRIKKNDLLGQQFYGIVYAANAISDKVKELDGDGAVVRAVETWLLDKRASQPKRLLSVAGSPRMATYDLDFGWGTPKKCESVHIDAMGSISLAQTRDDVEQGGVEIGVALERPAMDKFTNLFQGLVESFV